MTMLGERRDAIAPAGKKRELLLRLLRDGAASALGGPDSIEPATIQCDPAGRSDPFPLTEIQQAYWIGRSCGYEFGDVSIHAYVEVEGGDIDVPRLQRCWQQMVTRHDMLRAVVLPDGRQRILSAVPPYELRVTDVRSQDTKVAADTLAATREELSHQVLPAEQWPGFDIRATLLGGGRTRVHISIDLLHIDGGSLMILVDEWMRLYQDHDVNLTPLDLSYRDYVLGEIASRESDVYRRSAEYWHERVATLPPAPALPVVPRGTAGRTRFRRRRATLEPETWRRLKARATGSGLTPSAVLLAAYADVLACWSTDDAFTMNVTLFNRLPIHPQVNRILGDFTSMILLEVASGAGKFTDRATTIQKDLWTGLDHRHVSGIQVLRELARAQQRTTGAPMPVVFTSMLDLAGQGFRPPFPALRTLGEIVYSVTQTPQVWLDHQVLEEDGALVLTWDAVDDIFPTGLLDDMFAAYGRFLRRLADDDGAWQEHDRCHIPPDQLAQRAGLNATDVAVANETPLTLFLRQAQLRPENPAVITSDRTLTYAETRRRANRLGHTLRALGAGPDALVAVVMDKGWEQAVAALGIHLAGAAYLPVDPGLPAERRGYLLEHGQARIAVTQSWLYRDLEWPPGIERVCVDTDDPCADDDPWLAPATRPEHLSHVIYTSGSTGTPKGVMIEHRNAVNRVIDVNQRLGVGPGDRILALTALHHDLSVYDIFGVLAAGAAMVVPDAARVRDPGHWADLMARNSVTMWNSVPAFLQMLVEYLEPRADRPDLLPRSLRCAVLAGDWIPVTLPDRLRALVGGVQVIASGGPTETTIWDIWYPVGDVDPTWQSIPYGKPMNNTRYHVLDGALRPRPVWVAGQLHIGGAGLARGYWGDEAKTRECFITHPETGERLYRSGDLGRYLPDGNIEFLGRDDSQVKIHGHRIELGEIEAALHQHPAVDTAVVAAVGEPRQLQRLVAYVVPKHGSGPAGAGGPAAPTGSGTNVADFKKQSLAGISVLDPVARIDFKLQQWGIRRDTDRATISWPAAEPDEAMLRAYAERRSVRDYLPGPLTFAAFGELLRSLTQVEIGGLPKYRYASGGGLYPVQTYLYVKPDRVEGIAGGVYYHNPKAHQLVLMSSDARLDASTQMPHNRSMFDKAAFVVFLVGQLAAVEPLYGGLARDFCLLEAGYMSQLLMSVAPAHRIGLCPVGAMEFEPVRHFFDLDDSHTLVHLLFGGPADGEAQPPPAAAPGAKHPRQPASPTGDPLVEELRAFLSQKLPEQARPSAYVLLDSLPLTPNGKVDRRLLPPPEQACAPIQPDVPPRNDIERTLAAIATEILHTERLGIHQNFFDLGGTSIHMVQILNKVRTVFARDVPVTEIFRHPTISSLAGYLSEDEDCEPTLAHSDERASQRRAALARRDIRRREGHEPDREATSQEGTERR